MSLKFWIVGKKEKNFIIGIFLHLFFFFLLLFTFIQNFHLHKKDHSYFITISLLICLRIQIIYFLFFQKRCICPFEFSIEKGSFSNWNLHSLISNCFDLCFCEFLKWIDLFDLKVFLFYYSLFYVFLDLTHILLFLNFS